MNLAQPCAQEAPKQSPAPAIPTAPPQNEQEGRKGEGLIASRFCVEAAPRLGSHKPRPWSTTSFPLSWDQPAARQTPAGRSARCSNLHRGAPVQAACLRKIILLRAKNTQIPRGGLRMPTLDSMPSVGTGCEIPAVCVWENMNASSYLKFNVIRCRTGEGQRPEGEKERKNASQPLEKGGPSRNCSCLGSASHGSATSRMDRRPFFG